MNQDEQRYLVPEEDNGMQRNLEYSIVTESKDDAENWFVVAKDRLLDVNKWEKYSSGSSADFRLMDNHGKEVNRHARTNDLIKIDTPSSDPASGTGHDWVKIEAIEYDDYEDEDVETITMRIRPPKAPVNNSEDIAHFFDDGSASTLVIKRRGKRLAASYNVLNESPDTDDDMLEKARDKAIAIEGWLGLSNTQWKRLITGLIEFED
ncbi:MAG TPA: hypothetical protein VN721_08205 [Flavipsychrobacter sp.]|nr:hypothetical protein [Flavipsychrobacter sp.]